VTSPQPPRGIPATFVAVVVTAVVVLSGVVAVVMWPSTQQPTPSSAPAPPVTPAPSTPVGGPTTKCVYSDTDRTPGVENVGKPDELAPTTGTVAVVLKTNQGDIPVLLTRRTAPCAVQSLQFLMEKKFYDNSPCHRLTSGGVNVLQCGDPTGQGTGGPGYQFDDLMPASFTPVGDGSVVYPRGTVGMANAGRSTNGS
jgi:peptidyl-prolyl cis-trans isomerase B (cyclophilin B)